MRILSFDVESCTGKPNDGSLCSFGYILTKDGAEIKRGDILVNPLPRLFLLGRWGEEPTIKLAYPISEFRAQPRFNARYREIKGLFEECDLAVGFALGNDLRYINNVCDKFSLPRIPFKFLDVQLLGGLVIEELADKGLKAFAERFGIEYIEHRSDEDARVTYEVFERIIELSGKTLGELVEEYGIVCGTNGAEGYTVCYSRTLLKRRIDKMGKSTRKIIADYLAEHTAESVPVRGDRLKGKKVVAAAPLFSKDELAQKVMATAVAEGGICEIQPAGCDYYVTVNSDSFAGKLKKMSRKTKIIYFKNFESEFGPLEDSNIDNLTAVEAHYSAVVSEREEGAKKK